MELTRNFEFDKYGTKAVGIKSTTSAQVSFGKSLRRDKTIFNPIHYKSTGIVNWYEQDLEYLNAPSFAIDSIPTKIQLEYCFKAKILSDYLITFQNKEGYMKALTGIRKTIIPDWYYGDLRAFADGQTITSLVLIQFSPDRSLFRLYLFDTYYPAGSKRINEITKLIQEILATGRPTEQVLLAINTSQSGKVNQESGSNHSLNRLRP
jgi:hypothetical protein